MNKKCLNCGNQIQAQPHRVKKMKYCSMKCYHEHCSPHNLTPTPPKKQLIELYQKQEIGLMKLQKVFHADYHTIKKWLKHYKIKIRTHEESLKIRGKTSGTFKKGHKTNIGKTYERRNPNYVNWSKGLTKETDERIAKLGKLGSITKRKLYSEGLLTAWNKGKKCDWKITPEQRRAMLKGLIKRPTYPEKIILELINQNKLPYKYVGDGEKIIGGKNPDFIHKTENKIIEVFGIVFHSKKHAIRKLRKKVTKKGTLDHYTKLGYKTLILWDMEILHAPKEKTLNKIILFTG